jgi:hypothetical protein
VCVEINSNTILQYPVTLCRPGFLVYLFPSMCRFGCCSLSSLYCKYIHSIFWLKWQSSSVQVPTMWVSKCSTAAGSFVGWY